MRKSEMYLAMVEQIAENKSLSALHTKDPRTLNHTVQYMQETVNVWEDVKELVNKKYGDKKGEKIDRIRGLVNARLSLLKGTFTDGESVETKRKYVRNIENIEKFFTKKAVDYALSKVMLSDFQSSAFAYDGDIERYKQKGYDIKEENVWRTVTKYYSNGREYNAEVLGTVFYVPSQYQLKEADLIKYCMLYDYPYMEKYMDKLSVYHMEAPFEFYMSVKEGDKKGMVYIPYECLKKKSITPAINRMETYFKSYYKNKADYEKQMNLLNTELFKQFKKDVEGK